jgi:hypothetical protein
METFYKPKTFLRLKTYLMLVMAIIFANASFAQVVTGGSGNWSSTTANAPWPGGTIPANTADIVVGAGHTLTVDGNRTCRSITLRNGATLFVNTGITLTVSTNVIMVNGGSNSVSATIQGPGTISAVDLNIGNGTSLQSSGGYTYIHSLNFAFASLNLSGKISLLSYNGGKNNQNDNAAFNIQSGTVTVAGTITSVNENANNISTLSLETGAQTGTLVLNAATPSNFSLTGTTEMLFNGGNSTVNYNRAGNQVVIGETYNNLSLSGSGVKTNNGITIAGIMAMRGTATASSAPVFLAGSILEYNGSTAQTTGPEFPASMPGGVIINNTNGLTLNASRTVAANVDLQNGLLHTGTNTLTIGASGSISQGTATSFVNGKLARAFNSIGSKNFPVGKTGNFRPLSINFTALTGTSTVTVEQMESALAGTFPPGANLAENRHWAISQIGASAFTFNISLSPGSLSLSGKTLIGRNNGGVLTTHQTTTPNYTANGLTAFGNFAIMSCGPLASTISPQACNSYTAPDGAVYTSSGTYTATILSSAGCDSVITIHLTINNSKTSTMAVNACGSFTAPNGVVYSSSGIYTANLQTQAGCDSVVTINLTIKNSTNSNFNVVECGTYTAPDGVAYTTSGIYTATLENAAGCDSVITINLTINSHYAPSINVVDCDSYTAPDGVVYTSSGTYTAQLQSVANCDSIITINLTINQSSSSTISPVACDSYTAPDGAVYTSSGTYTATIENAAGCDSTITINLTIKQSTASSITVVECDTYTAPDGMVYNTSGIYTATLENAAGCDSIITINLTINNSSMHTLHITACNSYTAPDGAVYNNTGTYTAVLENALGCDSAITMHLTIKHSSTEVLNIVACESYTAPDGVVYEASGMYTAVLENAAGCDSIITINITIKNSITADAGENQHLCNIENTTLLANLHAGAIGQWSVYSGTAMINDSANPNSTVSNLTVGEVSTLVWALDNGTCAVSYDTIHIYSHHLPQVSMEQLDDMCLNLQVLELTGGLPAGGQYMGAGVSGNEFNPMLAGVGTHTIYYHYTDNNGCSNSHSTTFTISGPVVELGPDTTLCGGCITLHAGAAVSYYWSTGEEYPSIVVCQSSTIWAMVTDDMGCIATDTIHITISQPPVVDLGDGIIAQAGDNVVLDAGNDGAEYVWSTGATTQTITVTTSGAYYVKVTDEWGCSASDTILVEFTTGLEALAVRNLELEAYPNPNKGTFNLRFTVSATEDIKINVMDYTGAVVYAETISGFAGTYFKTLDLSGRASSLYFVQVNAGNQFKTIKVFVDK